MEENSPAVGARVERADGPHVGLTPWFKPGVLPVRDGVYLTRTFTAVGPSECWHAMRWDCRAYAWFSADSVGREECDVIGWDYNNRMQYWWRGLAA